MKKLLFTVLLWLNTTAVFTILAQNNWESSGLPGSTLLVRSIYTDTLNNFLYVGGDITENWNFSIIYLCRYNGNSWDTLGPFNNSVASLITYNGDLIAGGFFSNVSGVSVNRLARFDGTNWYPFGNFNANVRRLKIINGELHAMGSFSVVDSIQVNGLAKWNGNQWTDVFSFPIGDSPFINDIVMYQNDLYVCGNFLDLGVRDMAVFKNGTWQKVGEGFSGGFTGLNKMTIYNNELIVGGLINQTDGNVGNGIQKWNGTSWSKLGSGVQSIANLMGGNVIVHDMEINNNELYVAGNFNYAGDIPARKIAKWDGDKWCGLGTDSEWQDAGALAFYNDTLFVHAPDSIDGVFFNRLAKWTGGNYIDTCSIPLNVNNVKNQESSISIYPNPAQNILNINFPTTEKGYLSVMDIRGATLKEWNINEGGNKTFQVDLGTLLSGIYFIQWKTSKIVLINKFIKQ